jgi:hypothetical protein
MSDIETDDFVERLMSAPRNVRVRAVKARLHLRKWRQFMGRPWSPPETLPAAIENLEKEGLAFIGLGRAVDLMAFALGSRPADVIELGARRRQASGELCKGAHNEKFEVVHGYPATNINPADFNFAERLGKSDNSLELGDKAPLFDVQIKARHFFAWLRERCGTPQPEKQSTPEAIEQPRKLSPAAAAREFKRWREERGENVPSTNDDVAHMKQFGVGRDAVRKLRGPYLKRKRGAAGHTRK